MKNTTAVDSFLEREQLMSAPLSLGEWEKSEQLLDRIVASGSTTTVPLSGASPRARLKPALYLALAACAVGAIVIPTAVQGTSAPTVNQALGLHDQLQGWSAVPEAVSSDEAASYVEICAHSPNAEATLGDFDESGTLIPASVNQSLTLISSERRGDFVSLMLRGSTHTFFCVAKGEDVYQLQPVDFADNSVGPKATEPSSALIDWEFDSLPIYSVGGTAGSDVVGVSAQLESGEIVSATVANGYWSLWLPMTDSDQAKWRDATISTNADSAQSAALLKANFAIETSDGTSHSYVSVPWPTKGPGDTGN